MEADSVNTPQAFAAANDKARLAYLRSLTVETAAMALERILNSWAETERSLDVSRRPPRRARDPLAPSLAILLEGRP